MNKKRDQRMVQCNIKTTVYETPKDYAIFTYPYTNEGGK